MEGKLLQVFKGHEDVVFSVAFSPDGKKILTGSGDKTARLWDLEGKLLQVFKGHEDGVWSVAFSPDGKSILTGSWDKTARLWDLEGKLLHIFKGEVGSVLDVGAGQGSFTDYALRVGLKAKGYDYSKWAVDNPLNFSAIYPASSQKTLIYYYIEILYLCQEKKRQKMHKKRTFPFAVRAGIF
jgi:WD40 repeat protein